jgi:gluconate 2-dehydrogenase gamma chain
LTLEDLSRRSLLQAIVAAIGAATLPFGWAETAGAADNAFSLLSAAEAADIDAIVAQIIPTTETPGAREAGVVHFIDRALGTVLSHLAADYRAQLAEFQAACRTEHPGAASFASLASDQQIAYLKMIDRTQFFQATHFLTLLGMFTMPAYGGNRDGVGWKLIGFQDAHAFQPPFGYYDRDYPGYVADMRPSK